jgi:hypothetical protein
MNARGLLLSSCLLLAACGAGRPRVATWDTPVPASEPRGTLRATVDLEAASDCDERFDLALYEDRAVELVTWDAGQGCVGRHVEIRYLSRRTSEDDLLRHVRALAKVRR